MSSRPITIINKSLKMSMFIIIFLISIKTGIKTHFTNIVLMIENSKVILNQRSYCLLPAISKTI